MTDFMLACAEQRATIANHAAETVAYLEGYQAGRQFALAELFYYTPLAMRHCQRCGDRFWNLFSISSRMRNRWRDQGASSTECWGVSMEHKGQEMSHCHVCYVAMGAEVKP